MSDDTLLLHCYAVTTPQPQSMYYQPSKLALRACTENETNAVEGILSRICGRQQSLADGDPAAWVASPVAKSPYSCVPIGAQL
jgi:hypothetical protein